MEKSIALTAGSSFHFVEFDRGTKTRKLNTKVGKESIARKLINKLSLCYPHHV